MENITVIFNKLGNTVDVWFDDPEKEFICEEAGDGVILKKDKKGKIIGFEKLNVMPIAGKIPELKFLIEEQKGAVLAK